MKSNILDKTVPERVIQYEKRSWAMKVYAAFRWGKDLPCSLRFVVIPYLGCHYKCKYCYAWFKHGQPTPKTKFRESLIHDIKRAKEFGLNHLVVMVSSSTDCLQPIENEQKDTLFALNELVKNGFTILIMTRNPKKLLEDEYFQIIKSPKVNIDVTIASLHENDPRSIFYGQVPPFSETIAAIKELSARGKSVRIKVEPIVPSVNGVQGQTREELDEMVRIFKDAGVKMIISKSMRLNEDVPPLVHSKFIDYYKENGSEQGITLTLSKEIRRDILTPLMEICKKYDMPISTCVETDVFSSHETSKCALSRDEIESKEWKNNSDTEELSKHVTGALSAKELESVDNLKSNIPTQEQK